MLTLNPVDGFWQLTSVLGKTFCMLEKKNCKQTCRWMAVFYHGCRFWHIWLSWVSGFWLCGRDQEPLQAAGCHQTSGSPGAHFSCSLIITSHGYVISAMQLNILMHKWIVVKKKNKWKAAVGSSLSNSSHLLKWGYYVMNRQYLTWFRWSFEWSSFRETE